jgi:elongator complex protein 1
VNGETFDVERIPTLAASIANRLKSANRHSEAGRVLLDYGQDVEASIRAYCEGSHFKEAIRIAHLYSQSSLIESIVATSLEDAVDTQLEAIEELSGQVEKQVARLDELALIKAKDPGTYTLVDHLAWTYIR